MMWQLGKKKKIKVLQIGTEELKLSQFVDYMILYIKKS